MVHNQTVSLENSSIQTSLGPENGPSLLRLAPHKNTLTAQPARQAWPCTRGHREKSWLGRTFEERLKKIRNVEEESRMKPQASQFLEARPTVSLCFMHVVGNWFPSVCNGKNKFLFAPTILPFFTNQSTYTSYHLGSCKSGRRGLFDAGQVFGHTDSSKTLLVHCSSLPLHLVQNMACEEHQVQNTWNKLLIRYAGYLYACDPHPHPAFLSLDYFPCNG